MHTTMIPPALEEDNSVQDVPLSLRAAEDVLRRRLPQEQNPLLKQKLFDLAQIRLESARQEVGLRCKYLPAETSEHLRFELQSVESLLNLCKEELASVKKPT